MNSYVVAGLAAKALRENRDVAMKLAQLEELRDKVDYQMLEIFNLIDEVKKFENHEEYGKVARQLIRRWHIVEQRERAKANGRPPLHRSQSMSRNVHDKASKTPRRENEGCERQGRNMQRRNIAPMPSKKYSPHRDMNPCDSSVSVLSTASDNPGGYNVSAPRKGILKKYNSTSASREKGLTYRRNFTWKTPPRVPESDGQPGNSMPPGQEMALLRPPEKPPVAQTAPVRTAYSSEEWRNTFAKMKNLAGTNQLSLLSPRDPRLTRGSHSITSTPSASLTSETGYGSVSRPINQVPPSSVNSTPSASLTSENGFNNLDRPVKQEPPSAAYCTSSTSLISEKSYCEIPLKEMHRRSSVNSSAPVYVTPDYRSPRKRGPPKMESLGTIKLGPSGGQSTFENNWKRPPTEPNFRVPASPVTRPPVYDKDERSSGRPLLSNMGFKVPFVMPDTSRPPPPITRPVRPFAPVKQYCDEIPKPTPPTTPVGVVPNRPNRTPAKKNIKMDASPPISPPESKEGTSSDGELSEGEIVDSDSTDVPQLDSVKQKPPPIQPQKPVPVVVLPVVEKKPSVAVKILIPPALPAISKRLDTACFRRIPKLKQARPSIPRLFDLCEKACEKSARGAYYGRVPFALLSPLLEKYSPKALYEVEITMPWLEDDIDRIWMKKLHTDFPAAKLFPGESNGQAYRRCVEELEDESVDRLIRSIMEARMKPKIKCAKKAPVKRNNNKKPPGAPKNPRAPPKNPRAPTGAPKTPRAPRQRAKRGDACK